MYDIIVVIAPVRPAEEGGKRVAVVGEFTCFKMAISAETRALKLKFSSQRCLPPSPTCVCMYVYACMCMCVHVCVYICVHSRTHRRVQTPRKIYVAQDIFGMDVCDGAPTVPTWGEPEEPEEEDEPDLVAPVPAALVRTH